MDLRLDRAGLLQLNCEVVKVDVSLGQLVQTGVCTDLRLMRTSVRANRSALRLLTFRVFVSRSFSDVGYEGGV